MRPRGLPPGPRRPDSIGASRVTAVTRHAASSLRSPVARILAGSLVGQGLVILVSPVLTRVYSPADLGALSIVTALSSLFGASATLGFDRALVIAPRRSGVAALAALALASTLVTATVVGIVSFVFRREWNLLLGSSALVALWWVLPVTVGAIGAARVASAILARQKAYSALAGRNAAQGIGQVLCNLSLAPLGGPAGLVLGLAAGRLCALVGLRGVTGPYRSPHIRVIGVAFARYKRYALISPWSSLVNVAGQQAPTLLLAAANGSAAVGLVGLTMRVLGSPVGIVADAVSNYFSGMLGGLLRSRSAALTAPARAVLMRTGIVAILGVGATVLTGPAVFGAVFGSEWREAGVYAQILVPSFAAMMLVSPVSQTLPLLERQGTQFAWDAGRLIATSGVILVTSSLGASIEQTLAAYSAMSVGSYLTLLGLVLGALRHESKGRRAASTDRSAAN